MRLLIKLSPHIDEDAPPMQYKFGDGKHPLFKQWNKMVLSAIDMNHSAYPAIGAKGLTVCDRWMSFSNFVSDMEPFYESDPSVPIKLRRCYLARTNLKAGFNPKNCLWVQRSKSVKIQARTILVDTIHGRSMTLKQLSQHLTDHAGEFLPQNAERFKIWIWDVNTNTEKLEKVQVDLDFIQPIKVSELRKRYQNGIPLLSPIHIKEDPDAVADRYQLDKLDRNRVQFRTPNITNTKDQDPNSFELFGEVKNKTEFKDIVLPTR